MDRVDDQVDQDLLQLGAVHQDEAACPVVSHHGDFGLVQEMLHQRQAIGDDAAGRMALDIAGIFLRPGELQQLGDDLADALDLLVDQAEFDLGLFDLSRR